MKELQSEKMLMAAQDPYKPETVLFESATPGTYNVNITGDGFYEVYCVAGGGQSNYSKSSAGAGKWNFFIASGGSGSGFVGTIKLNKGNLSLIIGGSGGDSSIGGYVKTYHGGNGDGSRGGSGGSGGSTPTVNALVKSQTVNTAGNAGKYQTGSSSTTSCAGGASVYGGYGAGGTAYGYGNEAGKAGYVKIIYKSLR